MSEVRLCDRPGCGKVFSVRSDGWSTFTAARFVKNKDTGRRVEISEQLDACPDCTGNPDEIPVAIAITAKPQPVSCPECHVIPGYTHANECKQSGVWTGLVES